ncbi:MAG TPA: hypothetical protein P5560_05145 [Thermotogota bacterium]|nr:hypothetical protein [Thermotogota bacterium]HRW92323.1 hypothetical protein [Thermotogota bacterium]
MFRSHRFRQYAQKDGKDFFRNILSYLEMLGYRFSRGTIQVLDGLFSLLLAPFGWETDLYSRYIYWMEEKHRVLWGKRYRRPGN